MMQLAAVGLVCLVATGPPRTAKEALQPFNSLIGAWKATCTPEGTTAERQAGFWTEMVSWQWHFQGADACLKFTIAGGKQFQGGELHYQPATDDYRLMVQPLKGPALTFIGKLAGKTLALDRTDGPQVQRFTIRLLHANRYLYQYETKGPHQIDFVRHWRAGATKEGESFAAAGSGGPECIVSGGHGTIRVTYKGQTYYVCCTGCRDEFLADPEKYLREAAARKKKGK